MSRADPVAGARSCAVTGAGGYVGSCLARHLRAGGWQVRELHHDRSPGDRGRPDAVPYALERGPRPGDLRGIDALIHGAWDFRPARWPEIVRVNVEGSMRLLEAASLDGVPTVVFVSTISAFDGCVSMYGRAKLAVERRARDLGVIPVRPGLVHGERPGGTLGALERVVSMSRIVPMVGDGSDLQYLAHEEDLCRLVLELCEGAGGAATGPILAAAERPHSLRAILQALARRRGRNVTLVPVPRGLILAALRAAEALGLPTGFRSDSLVSLANPDPNPDFGRTRAMRTAFRDFEMPA